MAALADARQRLAQHHIEHAAATDFRLHEHAPRMLRNHFSNTPCLTPKRVIEHRIEYVFGSLRRHSRNQFPLIRHVKRIKPKDFAGASDTLTHRYAFFMKSEEHTSEL